MNQADIVYLLEQLKTPFPSGSLTFTSRFPVYFYTGIIVVVNLPPLSHVISSLGDPRALHSSFCSSDLVPRKTNSAAPTQMAGDAGCFRLDKQTY